MAEPSNPRVKGYLGFIPGQVPNDFRLRAVDRQKIYVSIVDQILEGIRTGAFPPGSALPAERLLAGEFNVSRGSLREAIRVLEHAGCLEVRTGNGTFVTSDSLSKATRLRTQAMLAGDESPLDVIVARRAVEPLAASEAARHRHSRDVTQLRKTIKVQAAAVARGEDPFDTDLEFHVLVAAATHNPVLVALMDTIAAVMRQPIWRDFSRRVRGGRESQEAFLEQHGGILAAIEAGDSDRATVAMQEHVASVELGLLNQVAD